MKYIVNVDGNLYTQETCGSVICQDDCIYAQDFSHDPEDWITINGSHVEIGEGGKIVGGAGGKLNGSVYKGSQKAKYAAQKNTRQSNIKELRSRVDSLGKKMEKLAKARSYSGSKEDEANQKEYYKTQKQYNEAKSALNQQLDKEAAERKKAATGNKTFVNSFGEATKREITNQTYQRQQKRQQKQIEKFIGG